MAETYANPYGSPIARALAGLSKTIMSQPSDAERIQQAEAAAALQNKRIGYESAGDMFKKFGSQNFNRTDAVSAMIRGGINPDMLSGAERYLSANTFGAQDPRTTNATIGAGGSYGQTYGGFSADQANTNMRAANTLAEQRRYHDLTHAENQRQFDSAPQTVGTDTGPVIVKRAEAYGKPAVEDLGKVKGDLARRGINKPGGLAGMNETEQRFIGAGDRADAKPDNYMLPGSKQVVLSADGLRDTQGRPLPPGAMKMAVQATPDQALNSSTQQSIVDMRVARDQALNGIDQLDAELSRPNAAQAVGYIGKLGSTFNMVRSQVEAAGKLAGQLSLQQEMADPANQQSLSNTVTGILNNPTYASKAQQLGIDNAVLQSQIMNLAYMIAKAQDPGGRMSNQDIEKAGATIGASLGDPVAMRAVLAQVKQSVVQNHAIRERHMGAVYGSLPPDAQAPGMPAMGAGVGSAPAPAAPTSTAKWGRDAQGRPVRVQ